jgi:hypothetical protein
VNSCSQHVPDVRTAYGYCDYTDDGRPFYVGIGKICRVKTQKRNNKHASIANKHGLHRHIELDLTGEYSIVWKLLCEWEKKKIVEYNTFHVPGNIGCNFTLGGDGFLGFKRIKSQEERKRISDLAKERYKDPEARRKLGEAIHQAKLDPVKLQHHADAQKKRYSDPLERRKMHDTSTMKKRVLQYTLDGKFVAEYSSVSYAVQATGIKNIKLVAVGKRPRAGGFYWKYVPNDFIIDYDEIIIIERKK